jgi:probable F420-dependent oxidoreductase
VGKLELRTIGASLNVTPDDTYLGEAVELERLGYGTIWLPGGQIDRLDRLSAVVNATTAIAVGSAIISPDVYAADEVATLYAQLQATAPDRFVVGLSGSQKQPAISALHDYLDQLDSSTPRVPAEQRILAALGPRKLAIARDRCGGAMALLVTPAYTAEARRVLGPAPTLVIDQMVVLDDDPNRARESARGSLRFLSTVDGYRTNFTRMGFSDTEIADLGDRLVDELVAWGDSDAIAARVGEHLAAGADHVMVGILNAGDGDGDRPGHLETARQLAERLIPVADG